MKFLLSCCGVIGCGEGEVIAADKERNRRSEETRALVGVGSATAAATAARRNRRKRGRAGSVSADWKPTLRAISEDKALVMEAEKAAEKRAERVVKRKGAAFNFGCRSVGSIPAYADDYRRNHYTAAMPTFSATPFMI